MRPPFAVLAAAASLLLVTACSGSDEPSDERGSGTPSESSTVLDGAEGGNAVGSTEEVPFDDSVVDSGAQDAADAPATVLVPSDDDRKVVTVQVEVTSVEPGKVEGLRIDDVPPRRAKGAQAYFVSYRMEYVNGPVLRNFGSVFFDLVSGDKIVSNEIELYSGFTDNCGNDYTVKSFGKGAFIEGCQIRFVTKDQPQLDGVAWTAPVKGAPTPQVTWPLP